MNKPAFYIEEYYEEEVLKQRQVNVTIVHYCMNFAIINGQIAQYPVAIIEDEDGLNALFDLRPEAPVKLYVKG